MKDRSVGVSQRRTAIRGEGVVNKPPPRHRKLDGAVEMMRDILRRRSHRLPTEEHPETLTFTHKLAMTLDVRRNSAAAQEVMTVLVQRRQTTLGDNHPDTLNAMEDLATLLMDNRYWHEALDLYWEVLDRRQKTLEEDHPDTLFSMNCIAILLVRDSQDDEADKIFKDLFKKTRKLLEKNHSTTQISRKTAVTWRGNDQKSYHPNYATHADDLATMHNWAATLEEQGKLDEAAKQMTIVLDHRQQILGPDHPDTLTSLSGLADILGKQGELGQAAKMNKHLQLWRMALGKEHMGVLISFENLAIMLESRERPHAAVQVMKEVLDMRQKMLGTKNLDMWVTMSDLAILLGIQGDLVGAGEMMDTVLDKRRKALGEDHPDTLTSMHNLAISFEIQGKLDTAAMILRNALKKRRKKLGAMHRDTLISQNDLATLLWVQGNLHEAYKMMTDVLKKRRKILGEEHADTLASMSNLASMIGYQGKVDDAVKMGRDVVEKMEKSLGEYHQDTLASTNNLAIALKDQRTLNEALEMMTDVQERRERALGPEHLDTLTSTSNLAVILRDEGRLDEAVEMMKVVLEKRRELLGREHPDTLTSMENLAITLKAHGELDEAAQIVTESALLRYKSIKSITSLYDFCRMFDRDEVPIGLEVPFLTWPTRPNDRVLHSLPAGQVFGRPRSWDHVLGELSTTPSNLCRFFENCVQPCPEKYAYVKAFTIQGAMLGEQLEEDSQVHNHHADAKVLRIINPVLSEEPECTGFIPLAGNPDSYANPHAWLSRETNPYQADVGAVKHCLSLCETRHPQCRLTKPSLLAHSKLIDCRTRHVVKASPEYEYVALSYVWGTAGPTDFWDNPNFRAEGFWAAEYSLPLPKRLPRVIRDAITFVRSIGQRYLWVDQYCINQRDELGKQDEIQKMDLIYASAFLTVFAAAGNNSNYGLPGVGRTPRVPQPRIVLGDIILIANEVSKYAVRDSTWMTRGWTMQEAKFSRRRLFFTSEQMYYECDGMFCQESIRAPLGDLLPEKFTNKLFTTAKGDAAAALQEYLDCVYFYNGRQLSFESDSLLAFRGILHFFGTAQLQLYHCWAVPSTDPGAPHMSPSIIFAKHLRWSPIINVKRRHDFPSWSWLGWAGQVSFPPQDTSSRKINTATLKFWIERKNQTLMPLETTKDAQLVTESLDELSPFLHIEAAIFPISLAESNQLDQNGTLKVIDTEEKLSLELKDALLAKYAQLNARSLEFRVQLMVKMEEANKGFLQSLKTRGCSLVLINYVAVPMYANIIERNPRPSKDLTIDSPWRRFWPKSIVKPRVNERRRTTGQIRSYNLKLNFLLVQADRSGSAAERIGIVTITDNYATPRSTAQRFGIGVTKDNYTAMSSVWNDLMASNISKMKLA